MCEHITININIKKIIMKEFESNFEKLAMKRNYAAVFNDFLDYALNLLSVGYIKENMERLNEEYSEKELQSFKEMLFIVAGKSEGFHDALGDVFMDYVSHGNNGQFFTPSPISDMMTQILGLGESKQCETICDPCCGSGRMLLSATKFHVTSNEKRPFCYGSDVDLSCVKMTTINMLMNSIPGEIAWMNALSLEHWRSYKIELILIKGMWLPSVQILEAGQTTFIKRLEKTLQEQPEEIREQLKNKIEVKQLTLDF